MKNLISIALITLCCSCIENNLQKNIYLNYKLILLAPTEDSSSVAFKRDAVFILHRYSEEKKLLSHIMIGIRLKLKMNGLQL